MVEIKDGSFADLKIKSVVIPNSVTSIDVRAFSGCTSLTSVTIPNNVTSIGDSAFSGCRSLTSVTIPNSVTSIGDSAFSGCRSLTSVTIPNGVTSIGDSAVHGCTSLTSINVAENNNRYASIDGVLFNKDYTVLVQYPTCKEDAEYTIPNSVTSIGYAAFCFSASLTSVTIPNSVTSIGNYAFFHCTNLTSVTIPDSVTNIGGDAFEDCTSLTSVTLTGRSSYTLEQFFCKFKCAFDDNLQEKIKETVRAKQIAKIAFCKQKISSYSARISTGGGHTTVGLKSDGTAVAVGPNKKGQCNVSNWTDIIAISTGYGNTIGLKSDGTVVATRYTGDKKYDNGQRDVESWKLF